MKFSVFIFFISIIIFSTQYRFKSLIFNTTIVEHYARTTVKAVYESSSSMTEDAIFSLVLPDKATIVSSTFSLEINPDRGTFKASTVDKKRMKAYEATWKLPGQRSYYFVAELGEKRNVLFEVTYHEMLKRTNGVYYFSTYLYSKKMVNLEFHTNIYESVDFASLYASQETSVTTVSKNRKTTKLLNPRKFLAYQLFENQIYYSLNSSKIAKVGNLFLSGNNLLYSLYPDNLQARKVYETAVVFLVDISNGMSVKSKFKDVRTSICSLIDSLSSTDQFTVISFGNSVSVYKSSLQFATKDEKATAKTWVNKLSTSSSSDRNIHAAVSKAIEILDKINVTTLSYKGTPKGLIVLVSSGEATSGITDSWKIRNSISSKNSKKHVIHSISYGDYSNTLFLLQLLSKESAGSYNLVYPELNIDSQMKKIFGGIKYIRFKNMNISYSFFNTSNVSTTLFPTAKMVDEIYDGSEITIPGSLVFSKNLKIVKIMVNVSCSGVSGDVRLYDIFIFNRSITPYFPPPSINEYFRNNQLWSNYMTNSSDDKLRKTSVDYSIQTNQITPIVSIFVYLKNEKFNVSEIKYVPIIDDHVEFDEDEIDHGFYWIIGITVGSVLAYCFLFCLICLFFAIPLFIFGIIWFFCDRTPKEKKVKEKKAKKSKKEKKKSKKMDSGDDEKEKKAVEDRKEEWNDETVWEENEKKIIEVLTEVNVDDMGKIDDVEFVKDEFEESGEKEEIDKVDEKKEVEEMVTNMNFENVEDNEEIVMNIQDGAVTEINASDENEVKENQV